MKYRMYDRLRDQRGAALVLTVLGITVFLGMVALAVDLGCAYRLEVDGNGDGLISVALGSVALEQNGYTAIVPEGARCRIHADRGPGIPWFRDAPDPLKQAIDRLAVAEILANARPRDAMSLWHLLWHVDDKDRWEVVDRMIELIGEPDRVWVAVPLSTDDRTRLRDRIQPDLDRARFNPDVGLIYMTNPLSLP